MHIVYCRLHWDHVRFVALQNIAGVPAASPPSGATYSSSKIDNTPQRSVLSLTPKEMVASFFLVLTEANFADYTSTPDGQTNAARKPV